MAGAPKPCSSASSMLDRDTSTDFNCMNRILRYSKCSVRSGATAPTFDKYLIIPILVCAYSLIIGPMLLFEFPASSGNRVENKIFWPLIAAIALGCFALGNRSRLTWPRHIVWLGAYLALAGASTLWAFKPEISFNRFAAQMMMIMCLLLPTMLAVRTADMMRSVLFCFAFGSLLNAVLILCGYSTVAIWVAGTEDAGYSGYFTDKNALGQFAAFAILLSFHEILKPGWRRVLGFIIVVTGAYLIFAANSKAALGCVLLAAILSKLLFFISKKTGVGPAIVLLAALICYGVLSRILGNLIGRISWYLFHNYDLSGRTYIWDFVNIEIAKRPLFGWGYRSFWLVGPDSPTIGEAGGWIKQMPEAHNGYLDTILDTGHVGLVLFLVFIFTTLHAVGQVENRDPARAWLLLSIALFIVLVNFLESGWMRGDDPLWLMFVLVVAEAGRYRQPFHRLGDARPIVQRPFVVRRPPVLARVGGIDRLPDGGAFVPDVVVE